LDWPCGAGFLNLEIFGFARHNFFYLIPAALLLCSCSNTPYQEKVITIVITPLPVKEVKQIKRTRTKRRLVTREELREKWANLERVLKRKKLLISDLNSIRTGASRLRSDLEKDEPKQVVLKLDDLKLAIRTFQYDQQFIKNKRARTRALLVQAAISPEEQASYKDRMDALTRLVKDENFDMANEVLTDVQLDLRDARNKKKEAKNEEDF